MEEKVNDNNSFNNLLGDLKEKIAYFKDENRKPKKDENYLQKGIYYIETSRFLVTVATTSISDSIIVAGNISIVITISVEIVRELTLFNKVFMRRF